MKIWAVMGLVGALLLAGAFFLGGESERSKTELQQKEALLEQLKENDEIREAVENMSDAELCTALDGSVRDDGSCE